MLIDVPIANARRNYSYHANIGSYRYKNVVLLKL